MVLTGKGIGRFSDAGNVSVSPFRGSVYERFMGLYSYDLYIFPYVYKSSN